MLVGSLQVLMIEKNLEERWISNCFFSQITSSSQKFECPKTDQRLQNFLLRSRFQSISSSCLHCITNDTYEWIFSQSLDPPQHQFQHHWSTWVLWENYASPSETSCVYRWIFLLSRSIWTQIWCYSPRGEECLIDQIVIGDKSYSLIIAVSPFGIVSWNLVEGTISDVEFLFFLETLRMRFLPENFAILDNASIHHTDKVRELF